MSEVPKLLHLGWIAYIAYLTQDPILGMRFRQFLDGSGDGFFGASANDYAAIHPQEGISQTKTNSTRSTGNDNIIHFSTSI
jgi:hypothetical protein